MAVEIVIKPRKRISYKPSAAFVQNAKHFNNLYRKGYYELALRETDFPKKENSISRASELITDSFYITCMELRKAIEHYGN